MPRDVTITFGDGSSHIYNNVPDNVTPEQATARAQKDFPGKQVTHLDGGRGGGGQQQAPRIATGSRDDPFGALERRVQAQQGVPGSSQGESILSPGGRAALDWGKEALSGLWHGFQQAMPSDVLHKDPNTGKWVTGEAQAPEPQDKSWTRSISEFAGSLAGGGPGGASRLGAGVGGPIAGALERRLGARGFGAAERVGPFAGVSEPASAGTLQAARTADETLGTAGMRDRWYSPAARAVENISSRLPGGGAIREATTQIGTERAELTTSQIAENLTRGQERVIATDRAAYGALSNTDRQQVAAFWRVGGPDHIFQALQQSGQNAQMSRLIQQATTVLSPGSQRYIAAEMLSRLGRDANGVFSAETFMRNWGQIAPEAQTAIFGPRAITNDYARSMSELVTNVRRIQQAAARDPMAALRHFRMSTPMGVAVGVAGGAVSVEAVIHGLLSPKTAVIAGGALASNKIISEALTNPSTVKWLASQAAKKWAAYESAQDNAQLSEMPPTLH